MTQASALKHDLAMASDAGEEAAAEGGDAGGEADGEADGQAALGVSAEEAAAAKAGMIAYANKVRADVGLPATTPTVLIIPRPENKVRADVYVMMGYVGDNVWHPADSTEYIKFAVKQVNPERDTRSKGGHVILAASWAPAPFMYNLSSNTFETISEQVTMTRMRELMVARTNVTMKSVITTVITPSIYFGQELWQMERLTAQKGVVGHMLEKTPTLIAPTNQMERETLAYVDVNEAKSVVKSWLEDNKLDLKVEVEGLNLLGMKLDAFRGDNNILLYKNQEEFLTKTKMPKIS